MCHRWDRWTHPDPHETVSEDNPRQQEYKGLVTTEERRSVCCVDLPEGLQVQVVGEDPQQAKWSHLGEKHPGRQPVVPEKTTTLPVQRQEAKQNVRIHTVWLTLWDGNQMNIFCQKKTKRTWGMQKIWLWPFLFRLLLCLLHKGEACCSDDLTWEKRQVDRSSTAPQEETSEKKTLPVLGVVKKTTKETLFAF